MQAHLQRVEVEPALAHDHDLAVHHAALGQARAEGGLELGEVAVERLQVAALDVEAVAVAEHDRAEAVPLRLEEPAVARGQLGRELGEHRLDRRLDREARRAGRPSARARAPRGDAPLGRRPARVERLARLVEVDRPAARGRRGSACPCAPRGRSRPRRVRSASGARHQQVVDAHAEVLVEVAGAVVPPGVAPGLRVVAAVGVDEAPAAEPARTPRAPAARRACRRGRRAGPRRRRPSGATLKSPPSTSGSLGISPPPRASARGARTRRAWPRRTASRPSARSARRGSRRGRRRSRPRSCAPRPAARRRPSSVGLRRAAAARRSS